MMTITITSAGAGRTAGAKGLRGRTDHPAPDVSDWARNTLEPAASHRHLIEAGGAIVLNRDVAAIHPDRVETNCTDTDRRDSTGCDAVVVVAARVSNDGVYQDLLACQGDWADAGIGSVTFARHRHGHELDRPDPGDALSFRHDVTRRADRDPARGDAGPPVARSAIVVQTTTAPTSSRRASTNPRSARDNCWWRE